MTFYKKGENSTNIFKKNKYLPSFLRHGCIGLHVPRPSDADLGSSLDGSHSSVAKEECEEKAQDEK